MSRPSHRNPNIFPPAFPRTHLLRLATLLCEIEREWVAHDGVKLSTVAALACARSSTTLETGLPSRLVCLGTHAVAARFFCREKRGTERAREGAGDSWANSVPRWVSADRHDGSSKSGGIVMERRGEHLSRREGDRRRVKQEQRTVARSVARRPSLVMGVCTRHADPPRRLSFMIPSMRACVLGGIAQMRWVHAPARAQQPECVVLWSGAPWLICLPACLTSIWVPSQSTQRGSRIPP